MRLNKAIIFSFILLFLFCKPLYTQTIEGKWYGTLQIENTSLPLSFTISLVGSSLKGTMDSPSQGVSDIEIESVTFENSLLQIKHSSIMMEYTGVCTGDKIIGTFRQSGLSLPLNLSRRAPLGSGRPQTPDKPYPYRSEEILFTNYKDSIVLSGTLTLPKKDSVYNAIILISGSGPQNRDQEIMGHKPFLILSDHLTKAGFAVLRFDDRGFGLSGGNFAKAITTDFAEDVYWAYRFLKERDDIGKIGLIGHSEGGIVASMVASKYRDEISFIVLMAATALPGKEIILAQQELISSAGGISAEDIASYRKINEMIFDLLCNDIDDLSAVRVRVAEILRGETKGSIPESAIKQQVNSLTSPWMIFFLNYNPSDALKYITCPVLAINGTKDLQVPSKENLDAIFYAITGEERPNNKVVTHSNINVTTIEFEGLNHLFQYAKSGHPNEYSTIEETINAEVLETIKNWILSVLH